MKTESENRNSEKESENRYDERELANTKIVETETVRTERSKK